MAPTSTGYLGIVDDQGALSTINAKCAGVVSGGNWVVAGSNTLAATLSLSGGAVVFKETMINVVEGGSGTARPLGLAIKTAASGGYVAVLNRGLVILPANGAVTAGAMVAAAGTPSCIANTAAAGDGIGMALTSAASGTNAFALMWLNI